MTMECGQKKERETSLWKTQSVPTTMSSAEESTRLMIALSMMGSDAFRGARFTTSPSTGSTPRLCAGGPSMMILIQRICMAFRGFGSPARFASATMLRAATLVESWKVKKLEG